MLTMFSGHESRESVTEAYGAWNDSSGYEADDKCAWSNLYRTATGNFFVQPEFSNGARLRPPGFTVTDNTSATASQVYSLTVNPPPPPSITGPASLPGGTVGVAYPATTVTATGGVTPYTWLATGLPPGLSISSSTGRSPGRQPPRAATAA